MEPHTDPTQGARGEFEDMIRRRRNLGAVIAVLGAFSLFAMVYLFVPPEDRGGQPVAAARQSLSR